MYQISECEFVLLRYLFSRIIRINKNLALILEFTVLKIQLGDSRRQKKLSFNEPLILRCV